MTEFKPNPFKIAWEDEIVKKINKDILEDYLMYGAHNPTIDQVIHYTVEKTIKLYKQELEKNKGLKE